MAAMLPCRADLAVREVQRLSRRVILKRYPAADARVAPTMTSAASCRWRAAAPTMSRRYPLHQHIHGILVVDPADQSIGLRLTNAGCAHRADDPCGAHGRPDAGRRRDHSCCPGAALAAPGLHDQGSGRRISPTGGQFW
jgi:hypothetical protein